MHVHAPQKLTSHPNPLPHPANPPRMHAPLPWPPVAVSQSCRVSHNWPNQLGHHCTSKANLNVGQKGIYTLGSSAGKGTRAKGGIQNAIGHCFDFMHIESWVAGMCSVSKGVSGCLLLSVLILLPFKPVVGALWQRGSEESSYPWGYYDELTDIPQQWILANHTFEDTLRKRVATKDGVVIFTTLRLGVKVDPLEVVAHAANWCYWLNKQGLLNSTLLITTDERTWEVLHERGLPGDLDLWLSLLVAATAARYSFFLTLSPACAPDRSIP